MSPNSPPAGGRVSNPPALDPLATLRAGLDGGQELFVVLIPYELWPGDRRMQQGLGLPAGPQIRVTVLTAEDLSEATSIVSSARWRIGRVMGTAWWKEHADEHRELDEEELQEELELSLGDARVIPEAALKDALSWMRAIDPDGARVVVFGQLGRASVPLDGACGDMTSGGTAATTGER